MAADSPVPSEAAPPPTVEPSWELSHQWQRFWRTLRYVMIAGLCVGALLVVGQIYLFYSLFATIHFTLGIAFVVLISAVLFWFVGRPLVQFWRMPAIAKPPDVDLHEVTLTTDGLDERFSYDRTYLSAMLANPALAPEHEAIATARNDLDALQRTQGQTLFEKGHALNDFEHERILPLLTRLDREMDAYIRREAMSVGTATAVSLNGSIDAFIVLWRNVNMISRIARMYYGRPNLRLSLTIIGDVAASVILSRVLEDLSETAGETLGGLMNRLGGIVAGPLMDGSVNALVTLKLGYAAKRRCRSFEVWTERRARQISREILDQVRKESGNFITDLVKLCGGFTGTALDVAGKAWTAPKSAWTFVQGVFGRRPVEEGTPQ